MKGTWELPALSLAIACKSITFFKIIFFTYNILFCTTKDYSGQTATVSSLRSVSSEIRDHPSTSRLGAEGPSLKASLCAGAPQLRGAWQPRPRFVQKHGFREKGGLSTLLRLSRRWERAAAVKASSSAAGGSRSQRRACGTARTPAER